MAVTSLTVCIKEYRIVGLLSKLTDQFGGLISMPRVGQITDNCTNIEVTYPDFIRAIEISYNL